MKISYDWLLQFISTPESINSISETLTEIGLEVEGVEPISSIPQDLSHLVVAEVQEVFPHPNADRLKITKVFDGKETYQVVCGASNVKANMKVAFAQIGAVLQLKNGDTLAIKKSKIRGEESYGMLCAEDELGLSDDHAGIMELDEYALIGTPLKEYLNAKDDYVFEIGLTPNRSDAMSHYGVARDLHAGMKLRNLSSEFHPIQNEFLLHPKEKPSYKVILENEDCKRYALAHIQNVKVKPSPDWLQDKLQSIGLEPINNIVDVTNYILHSYGQPLHAFDASKVEGDTILVGNNQEGTSFVSLDQTERKLNANDLMIKDGNNKPMCIAGVFGGIESGVADTTTDIVLESAYFDPVAVRKSAKRHGLNTDASFRFERGVDPEMTLWALKKATELIVELAEGTLNEEYIDINHLNAVPKPIEVRLQKVYEIIGNEIPLTSIKEIFTLLEFDLFEENENVLKIVVPAYRTDVTREIDVIEDILRIYGYNTVEIPKKVSFSIQNENLDSYRLESKISELLADIGYFEVLNNSLTTSTDNSNEVELINPLSKDLAVMRTSMLPGVLENISYNINRNNKDLKFFEWGKIYQKMETQYIESPQLALALTGDYWSENWQVQSENSTFFQLKGALYAIFNTLGIAIKEKDYQQENCSEALQFLCNKKAVGYLGKVNNKLLKKLGIKQTVWFAELNVEVLIELGKSEPTQLKPIPKFPSSRRDLALLLDKSIEYKELRNTALQINNQLLKSVNLFDVYEGKNIEEGKKSYALSYLFQDENKTLKDEQINTIMDKIIAKYESEYNAILRS